MTQGERTLAEPHAVEYICITPDHVVQGKSVPDEHGTLTVNGRHWAYCSAGLKNAPHDWKETGGVALEAIHHAELPATPRTP